MNLGLLFRQDGERLIVDVDKLRAATDGAFVEHLLKRMPVDAVQEMQMPEPSNKHRFAYFRIGETWFSFAWDGRERTLIASERDWKQKWRFIVGYRQMGG